MSLEQIHELYAYNRWANARALGAAAELPAEEFTRDLRSSFPSVRDTLVHIMGAEWVWLSRWRGTSPRSGLDATGFPDVASIRRYWAEIEEARSAFLEALDEEALGRVVAYHNLKGEAFEYPLRPLLQHVVNHSTYHRGQVTTLLRQLGAKPVATDFVLFWGERQRQPR